MVPDTTTIEVSSGTVYWENTSFRVSAEEARSMAERIREEIERPGVDGVLVDNSEAEGTWPSETDPVWDGLMADIYAEGLHCATVCPSATNALHVNRLSKENDTDDLIRAFEPDREQAAYEFVGTATV